MVALSGSQNHRPDSHLCETAIYKQFRSRDVAAVVGCKKHDGFGSLIRSSEPSSQRERFERLAQDFTTDPIDDNVAFIRAWFTA